MIRRLRAPLAFAIAAVLAGGAHAASPQAGSAFDPASLDAKFNPCDDFYGYVNAKWIAANPIPGDRTRWGTFDELREASLKAQHKLIEDPAVAKAAKGTIEQKLADFYATGMDEAAIEKAGIAPLQGELKKIAALKSSDDLVRYLTDAHARGLGGYFGFGASPDFKNSSMMIAYAGEDGLGLPERAYYLEDRADYVKIRGEYVAHIEKTLTLAGVKPEEAKQDAQWIIALETRDAKASLSPIEARDPKNQYHYVSVADADKATPHFSWTKFLAAQGLSGVQGFSLSQPEWFAEFDKMLTEVPIAQWKAYLRFHAIDEAAPYLSHAFVEEHFDFNQHKLRGQKEIEPRWKRTLNAVNGHLGQAMGQLYVKENFPPAAKQSAEQLVGNLQAALKIRIEKLDWMSAETKTKALEKLSTFRPKIGYPDKWRDWTGLTITRSGYLDNVLAASKFNHDRLADAA